MSLPVAFDANANATVVILIGGPSVSTAVPRTASALCRTTLGTMLHVRAPYEIAAPSIRGFIVRGIIGSDTLHRKP